MPTSTKRALELTPQEWELLRDSIIREMKRWPEEHVTHFELARLHLEISRLCRGPRIYKNSRRIAG